jgi:hypothetical protein
MNDKWKVETIGKNPDACKSYSSWHCYDCPFNATPCDHSKTNCGWGGTVKCTAKEAK